MKQIFSFLVLLISVAIMPLKTNAQCNNLSQFGSAVAPAIGANVVITTCQYGGEFAPITSVAAGAVYTCASSVGTDYITIRQGTSGGPVIAFGPTPLTWTSTVAGSYFMHTNTNISCGTQNACRTTNIGRPTPPNCTNASAFGSGTAPAPGNQITLSTCVYAGEYSTLNTVVAGQTYSSSSSVGTDYITIRSGTFNGPLVAAGNTPLIWTATTAGTHFIHINASSACATQNACRTSIVRNISPTPPANDNCANATALAAVATVTGTTFNATLESPAPPSCITTLNQPGVWYTVTGNGNRLGASLCGTPGWDSKIFVYTGACGSFSCITGNDDNGPLCAGAAASAAWCSVPGTVYRILVTGFSGTSDFTLSTTQTVIATPTISATSSVICSGNSTTLSATGSATFTWNPGALTGSVQTFTPASTQAYTVIGVDPGTGCNNFASSTVSVNITPTISVPSSTMCSGYSYVIVPSGALSYSVSGGNFTVNPLTDANFTVTGSSNGCPASNTAICSLTVLVSPTISVNSGSICYGNTFTINPSGASTYTYSGGTNIISPNSNISYSVVGTSTNGCISPQSAVSSITVVPSPTISISPTVTSICAFSTTTLTASGALSYSWSTGSTSASALVSPSITSSYNVVGTDAQGCSSSANAIVVALPLPNVSVSPPSQTICALSNASLMASGATTFTWNTGVNTPNTVVNPSVTSIYTVSGTDPATGCVGTQTAQVITNPLPAVAVAQNGTAVCIGSSASFTLSGAVTYTWSTGFIGSPYSITPTASTVYTVVSTGSNNCKGNTLINMVVNPLPTISLSIPGATICAGESITFNASGANTYTWLPGNSNGSAFTATPTNPLTLYTVNGTDINGCENSTQFQVRVTACTGIGETLSQNQNIFIYPNPSSGIFNVDFGNIENKEIRIVNLTGQVVQSFSTDEQTTTIDITEHAKGIYFVHCTIGNTTHSFKIVFH